MQVKAYTIFFLFLILLPLNTHAEDNEKHFTIGFGGQILDIADDDNSRNDTDFDGTTVSFFYAPTHEFGVRAEVYSLENNDNSNFEMNGYTLSGYIGIGLTSPGFKMYAGGGIFNETLESDFTNDKDFSGFQVNGGIGYNWDHIALDGVIGFRDPNDYEDEIADEPIVTTLSITVSIRL